MAVSTRPRRRIVTTEPGRERERTLVEGLSHLTAGVSVVVLGDGGIGKSHVATMLLRSLAAAGRAVVRLKPSTTRAALLWTGVDDAPAVVDPGRQFTEVTEEVFERALALSTSPIPILIVDDAHIVTAASARWICALVNDGRAIVLATMLSRHDGDRSATDEFTQLWLDDRAVRIDLAPFDLPQTQSMISSRSDGFTVDWATQLAVFHASGGNPLLIRELMRDVRENGLQAGATSSLLFPLSSTPSMRMQAVVAHRTRPLTSVETDALAVMARLDGIPLERALRYIGNDTLRRLLASDLLTLDAAGMSVTTAHRVDAEALASTLETNRAATLSRAAAREMLLAHRAGVTLQPLEYVFIAETAAADRRSGVAESRVDPIAADGAPRNAEWAEICLIASSKSLAMGSLYSALTFARESISSAPTAYAIVEESRAQSAMGNHPAAACTLGQLDQLDPSAFSRDSALLCLRWRVALSTWVLDDVPLDRRVAALSHAISADDGQDILILGAAMEATLACDWTRAADLTAHVIASNTIHPLTRLTLIGIHGLALASLGQGTKLGVALRRGMEIMASLPPGTRASENLLHRKEINHFLCSLSMAQIIAGLDIRPVRIGLAEAMNRAIERRDFGHVAVIGFLLGYVEFGRGELEPAEVEFRLAVERLTVLPDSRWQLWLTVLHARALAQLGRSDESADVLATARSLPFRDYPLRSLSVQWSRLDVNPLQSSSGLEHDAVMDVVKELDGTTPKATLDAMFLAVVSGVDVSSMIPRVRELRADTDLPAFMATADVILGIEDDDPQAVDEAAQVLADAEYLAFAQFAALRATTMYAAHGRRVAAAASQAFADSLTGSGADMAASDSDSADDLADLTPREREIVLLVAAGLSNREIAAQLFLSVRTVESHFYQARVKLGAPTRRELSAHLTRGRSGPAY